MKELKFCLLMSQQIRRVLKYFSLLKAVLLFFEQTYIKAYEAQESFKGKSLKYFN